MKQKRKKRRLKKWVIITLNCFMLIITLVILVLIFKQERVMNHEYEGEVVTQQIEFSNEDKLYTFNQDYIQNQEITYLSLNDFYNFFVQFENNSMELIANEGKMYINTVDIELEYDYQYGKVDIKNKIEDQEIIQFLTDRHFSLKEFKFTPHYICPIINGEVYFPLELVDYLMLKHQFSINLETGKIERL